MNLTLYTVSAFVVLDTDGQRVLAKYYAPKLDGLGALTGAAPAGGKAFSALKEQRVFEKGLFGKTKKPNCVYYMYVQVNLSVLSLVLV
jgi:coatomer subunit zeta